MQMQIYLKGEDVTLCEKRIYTCNEPTVKKHNKISLW